MHFKLAKWVERVIEEGVGGGEFDSTTEAIECAFFSRHLGLARLFKNRQVIDRELRRGEESGPSLPLEQAEQFKVAPSARVLASPVAREDLVQVWLRLGRKLTPDEAERYVILLFSQLILLVTFPSLGTPWRGQHEATRVLILGDFAIFYRPLPDGIKTIRILPVIESLETVQ